VIERGIVRLATWEDRSEFLELWRQYLAELERVGGEVRATEKTLRYFGVELEKALDGCGVAVVFEHDARLAGVHLSSLIDWPYETNLGKAAMAWGTFVAPGLRGSGVASRLRDRALSSLRGQGVRSVLFGVHPGNRAGLESMRRWTDARPFQTAFLYPLGGET
jgi:GNAT superfamily N-acetyltransferase